MATQAERNARLDALAAATKEWATAERTRLQNQAALAKKMLKGRLGSERLNNTTSKAATSYLADEVDKYLTGER